MADLRGIMLVVQLTSPLKKGEKPSVAPLIEYMEAGHPITPDLYGWILRALKKNKRLPGVFKYVHQPNRTPSAEATEKHVQAYFRIEELVDENISRKLCAHVRGLLPGGEQRAESSGKGKKIIILDGNRVRVFRWVLGEKPSRDDAIRIAALELNMSFSSVKQNHYATLKAIRSA